MFNKLECLGLFIQLSKVSLEECNQSSHSKHSMRRMETEIRELAERTAAKLKKLTEEEFAGLVFLPAEDME